MPIIRIELLAGRTVEQKRELVQVLTRETARIANSSPASIFVVIEDVAKENWGAGGELLSDKYPD
jgi:4-oxalocrotonate tautomerase